MIEFRIDAKPIAQPRHQSFVVNGQVRTYEAKHSHPIHLFKAHVRQAARRTRGAKILSGALSLSLDFIMPRPAGETRKTKPNPRYPHAKAPDIDNLCKAVMDALSGLLWDNDSHVAHLNTTKFVAAGGEDPHVLVRVCQMEVE